MIPEAADQGDRRDDGPAVTAAAVSTRPRSSGFELSRRICTRSESGSEPRVTDLPTWPWRRGPSFRGFRLLRTKLTCAYLALCGLLLAAVLVTVYSSIDRNAERAVRSELDASAVVFDRIWQLRTGQMHRTASLLAHDFGFRAAVATRDAATVGSALHNLTQRAGVDLAVAADPDGRIIAVEGLPAADLGQLDWVADIDDQATGVVVIGGVAYEAAVTSVRAPMPVGKLIFAQRLDRAELASLAQLSPIPLQPRLLLGAAKGGWQGVAGDVTGDELRHAATAVADGAAPQASHVGDWLEVARPLHALGGGRAALLLRYPLAEAFAPFRPLFALLLGLGLAGSLAAALGSAALAREVTRPISRLRDAARRFELGEPVQVAVEGRDEIAALGQAFNQMTDEIGRRAQALEQARVQAESANRAKTDFLANMSHEIRTPLNGILGMAQVLIRDEADPVRQGHARLIQDSGEALLGILNSVLDLSKIEAGQLEVELGEFELGVLARSACAPFAGLAREKGLAFEIAVAADAEGACLGDVLRLRQVLANLASNAVKFTRAGAVAVDVRRTGDEVVFEVRDTGCGIPAETQERIFERFAQADSSTTRTFGGAGLGLAICRELVSLMGGRIWLASAPGEGSTFGVALPLPPVAGHAVPADPSAEDEGRPLRILAAEDNPTNAMILKALLEPAGVDLVVTEDGEKAVAAFGAAAYDLVLMDIQMPNMNGVDATRAIRRREAELGARRTPIVAVSANVMNHQIAEYLEAGMDGVVSKPVQAEVLYGAIEQALEDAAQRAVA
jgi:signal transduction histidine kinase